MENRTVLTGLTPPQADGRACCWCGARTGRLVPVGVSETGGRAVACAGGRDWGRPCQGLVWAFVGFNAAGLFDTLGELRDELERRRAERVPVGPPADPRTRCARRGMLLVLLIGAVILLALIAGALDHGPMPGNPGTPPAVTTIGGPQ